jgi:hypothetical protein
MKEYNRVRYRKRKDAVIAQLGGKCVMCSTSVNLEVDHINPKEKLYSIGKLILGRNGLLQAELAKCQLLCVECHKQKTTEAQYVGHGGGLTGVRNCRCTLCGPMKTKYAREYKRKRNNPL